MKNFTLKPRVADFAVIVITAVLVCVLKFMGITEIPENSLVENIQLLALFGGILVCFFTRNNPEYKTLNRFLAMILILMFLREISYGRCIFCQIDGNPHEFYPWKHYKYGYLAHVFIGGYIAAIALYGIINKVWLSAFNALKSVKFPVISTVLAIFAIVIQLYAEKVTKSTFVEEISELSIYIIIATVIYYYNNHLINNNN